MNVQESGGKRSIVRTVRRGNVTCKDEEHLRSLRRKGMRV